MRNFIIFLLVLGAIGYFVQSRVSNKNTDPAEATGPITNPVYAEVRFRADIGSREFHLVAAAQGRDHADCQRMIGDLPDKMQLGRRPDGTPLWKLESSECMSQLDERTERLFNNKPTFVNYVAASPGAPDEREVRMIIWGVTAQEGELVCDGLSRMKQRWKGSVTCIRALPSQ
ncbi:MAG TPA: hypothetical protein VGH80_11585 [Xanthomonadaceae bacterium]|jgi:hypothetical protein